MSDFNQLKELCGRLGASPEQAETMATQLLKRAAQLAEARKISPAQALEHLLQILIHGRQGEVPPGFHESAPSDK